VRSSERQKFIVQAFVHVKDPFFYSTPAIIFHPLAKMQHASEVRFVFVFFYYRFQSFKAIIKKSIFEMLRERFFLSDALHALSFMVEMKWIRFLIVLYPYFCFYSEACVLLKIDSCYIYGYSATIWSADVFPFLAIS
jgi:hypothetical protein